MVLALFCIVSKTLAQTMVLDSSNVVVGYRYSCNTRNAEGNPVKEEYDIAMLIGKKIVAQQGLCELTLDEDNNDEYVRILTERQHNIPKIYMGWPDEDKMTFREKFMRYRDKVTKNPLYLSNPSSLVSPDLLRHKNIYQFGNGTEFVEMNGQIFNPHPNVFIPLEVE